MTGLTTSNTEADTATVVCRVLDVQRVKAAKLLALASVELNVDGVAMTIHGIQVAMDGSNPRGPRLFVKLPTYRTPDGVWRTAMEIPRELEMPLGKAVLETCRDMGLAN